jgi:hypothetical protein
LRKRKNRTIIETTNAKMHDQNLSMIPWERSMHDTVYVQNKSLYPTLKNITLEEAFTEMKPEIEHFMLFGYPVYFHVPKEKKSNLYPSGRKDMLWDKQ